METEKKYTDLVAKLKEWHDGLQDGAPAKETLEFILPDLKESEDERTRKEIIGFIQSQIEDGNSAGWDRWIAWLEEQKEQKPAEWSEIEDIADHLDNLGNTAMADTLRRFRPQKQEWSEEDEKMRNLIVAIFEVNHPNGFFKANEIGTSDMRGVHTEEIISWLKSLRPQPHWKPSEEQLRALNHFLDFHRPQYVASTHGWSAYEGLKSLYDHLLKLK